MTTGVSNESNQVWEIPFDGIEAIALTKGPMGHDHLLVTFSTAEKAEELVMRCYLTETNPRFGRYGFAGGASNHQRTLFGPMESKYPTLLDVLRDSIGPNPTAKVFKYTLLASFTAGAS
jgi:hypothetical protein